MRFAAPGISQQGRRRPRGRVGPRPWVPPAVSVASVGREIELRRHTDADDDVLTADGVRAALAIGARLRGDYDLAVSTGAQRATQTLACFLAALAQQVPGGVVVETGLRQFVTVRHNREGARLQAVSARGSSSRLVRTDF
jgi:hypothetical protein